MSIPGGEAPERIAKNERAEQTERYFWISFFLTLLFNQIPFQVARLLVRSRPHYSLALPVDALFPFLPWMISVYLGCFVFWFFLYRLVAHLPREKADRFFCANLLAKVIIFFFFVFFPTEMARPELTGTGFWEICLRFMYRLDEPNNLFPSLHCMIAWLCWAGVRGNKDVPLPWRAAALLMAVAVCFSTLAIRQHVLLDVPGGILLSEICYALASIGSLRGLYAALADRLLRLFSPARREEA
jgi:membrane-associated phospholipid phosphatase